MNGVKFNFLIVNLHLILHRNVTTVEVAYVTHSMDTQALHVRFQCERTAVCLLIKI